ncbi:transposase [Aquaspirillum sp. LM1]|uniref:transposase n=1 Tax=Aquaspirillum sp. LM1 TaxID=1938604 RepID=UPI0021103E2E|nr:transposase [Aquaspirillum sp. LM1]
MDMGITRFATLSDGTFYTPLHSFKRHKTALRRAQRAMNRKQMFSNNGKKAKSRIQRIHARLGNARRDYLHKCSTTIRQNHTMVVAIPFLCTLKNNRSRATARPARGSMSTQCEVCPQL